MSLFWKAYMLFFIVVFPMIMYYPISGYETRGEYRDLTDPYKAVAYLLLGLLLWGILIAWYYKRNLRAIFRYRASARQLMDTGKLIEATIITRSLVRRIQSGELTDLEVEFINFSGTPVKTTIEDIVYPDDEEPYENGDRLFLRADPELRLPYIMPEGLEFQYNKRVVYLEFLAFAAIIVFFAGYLVFSYMTQSRGDGWRFLTFFHPFITIPLSAFFYSALILGIKKMFRSSSSACEEGRFLLYGKKAKATMLKVSQTGTYINEQPQVKFELTYTDDTGRDHKVSFRRIVNLLEMHTLSEKQREILYLPDDPQKIKFL